MQEVFEKIIEKLKKLDLDGISMQEDDKYWLIRKEDAIKVVQQADAGYNNGWIPCSERLPEESLNSVIGWDEYRKRCCFVQYYDGGWHLAGKYHESVKIIAWQPVHEPYKPKGERI